MAVYTYLLLLLPCGCLFVYTFSCAQHCYLCVRLLAQKKNIRRARVCACVCVYSAVVVKMNELKRFSERMRKKGASRAQRRNKRGITI